MYPDDLEPKRKGRRRTARVPNQILSPVGAVETDLVNAIADMRRSIERYDQIEHVLRTQNLRFDPTAPWGFKEMQRELKDLDALERLDKCRNPRRKTMEIYTEMLEQLQTKRLKETDPEAAPDAATVDAPEPAVPPVDPRLTRLEDLGNRIHRSLSYGQIEKQRRHRRH